MLPRFCEVAKEWSQSKGHLCSWELTSVYCTARLHEVHPHLFGEPRPIASPFHSTETNSICHKFHHARVRTHALVESFRYRQARGRPQEAAREVRALLDLMRDNEAAVQATLGSTSAAYQRLLHTASENLKILDSELGDEELIKSVTAALAHMASKDELQGGPGGA